MTPTHPPGRDGERRGCARNMGWPGVLLAGALGLASPENSWCEPGAAPGGAPVEFLTAGVGCGSIDKVQHEAPRTWLEAPSAPGVAPRSDTLWIRVSAPGWTVSMPSNRAFSMTVYEAPRYDPERSDAGDPRGFQISFRHLGREVRGLPGAPSYLCFQGPRLGASELEVGPTGEFRAQDLNATQWRAAAFGAMLAMSLFSALFYLALRERVFLKYLGYLLAFALYLACETRAAHRLPILSGLDRLEMLRLTGMAIDLATAFAFLFAIEFMGLPRLAPRSARFLQGVAALLAPLTVVHGAAFVISSDALVQATIHASNLLVGAGALVLLAAAATCAWRGETYARFFIVGWTPLTLTAFSASVQQLFWSFTASLTLDAMLLAGAFESVVLAFGLAHRTLGYRRELDRATELVDHDPLSGLLNRRALLRFARAFDAEGDRRRRGPLALVIFDLDRFKGINDERGHAAGDACIRAFAALLGAEIRRSDLVVRYGGEEFLAVLPGASGAVATALAERVRARLEREGVVVTETRIPLTVSAGVAVGGARDSFDELLARADRVLYAAKGGGRNRVVTDESAP